MMPLGHEQLKQRFLKAMRTNRMHHAWLLHGQSGIGKAMQAKQMAAIWLCEANQHTEQANSACGTCHACHIFQAGSHPDFMRVERAWNEKNKRFNRDVNIEQIRKLLSFTALSGAESNRRVVLLDDAGLLNKQAANALLKGLEEPSLGSLLLIVCNDLMRLPATIRSRCMLERMIPLSDKNCRKALIDMGLSDHTLDAALTLAEGCPGRVACMAEPDHAQAISEWMQYACDLPHADIGEMQNWLSKHIKHIPHSLIADAMLHGIHESMKKITVFSAHNALMDAAWEIASWPKRVARQSLRPAPVLLAHILTLRTALRSISNS